MLAWLTGVLLGVGLCSSWASRRRAEGGRRLRRGVIPRVRDRIAGEAGIRLLRSQTSESTMHLLSLGSDEASGLFIFEGTTDGEVALDPFVFSVFDAKPRFVTYSPQE